MSESKRKVALFRINATVTSPVPFGDGWSMTREVPEFFLVTESEEKAGSAARLIIDPLDLAPAAITIVQVSSTRSGTGWTDEEEGSE